MLKQSDLINTTTSVSSFRVWSIVLVVFYRVPGKFDSGYHYRPDLRVAFFLIEPFFHHAFMQSLENLTN